jgi:hypothetical protein
MPLQTIRRVVRHLRSRGYNEPLRELRFATVDREIYFQHPDGTWEGDLRPDQIIRLTSSTVRAQSALIAAALAARSHMSAAASGTAPGAISSAAAA